MRPIWTMSAVAAVALIAGQAWADTAHYEIATPGTWLPLTAGTPAFGPTDRYIWDAIPSFLTDGGYAFWQTNPGAGWPSVPYGQLSFSVTQSGPAYLAVSTRFGGGGNSSGGWLPEVSYLANLEADGWQSVTGGLTEIDRLTGNVDVEYLVMMRESLAGESFTYRTEKYVPPVPLVKPLPSPPPGSSFVIDQSQSYVTATVIVGEAAADEQSPGSLTTPLAGTVVVDLSSPGLIRFVDAGGFSLVNQPGVFEPDSAPAQLAAVFYTDEGDPLVLGAGRDLAGTLASSGLAIDESGQFVPDLLLNAKTGRIDYSSPLFDLSGSNSLVGTYANDYGSKIGTLETIGGQQKLTIPFTFRGGGGGFVGLEYDFEFTGQIVAYSAVPEPATWTLALCGLIGCLGMRVLRSRRFE